LEFVQIVKAGCILFYMR